MGVPVEAFVDGGGEVSRLLSSPAAIRALPPAIASGIATSVEVAINAVFFWSVPLMAGGFVLALLLKEIPLRDTFGPAAPTKRSEEASAVSHSASAGIGIL